MFQCSLVRLNTRILVNKQRKINFKEKLQAEAFTIFVAIDESSTTSDSFIECFSTNQNPRFHLLRAIGKLANNILTTTKVIGSEEDL